jgi:hypothetical protein
MGKGGGCNWHKLFQVKDNQSNQVKNQLSHRQDSKMSLKALIFFLGKNML